MIKNPRFLLAVLFYPSFFKLSIHYAMQFYKTYPKETINKSDKVNF